MPDIWFVAGLAVCSLACILCCGASVLGKAPNDISLGSLAAVDFFVLAYGCASLVRFLAGETLRGEAWEFWGYWLVALMIPWGAAVWALIERNRWGNAVLALAGGVVLVMLYRMQQIWYVMR